MSEVTIGHVIPDFRLPSDEDTIVSPASLKGKTTILYFYPKDDTSGCTKQAIAFSQLHTEFEAENAIVIGFQKTKYHVAESFGVWVEKSMYGKKYMGIERSTFVIDTNGVIAQIWRKVKVEAHAEEVLKVVRKLAERV